MSRTALLLSGGLDSMVCLSLLLEANHHVEAFHFDYGHAAAELELRAAKSIANHFGIRFHIVKIDAGNHFEAGEVPFRNAALIFASAMVADDSFGQIAIGIHAGLPYPDCSGEFLDAAQKAISAANDRTLCLVSPLIDWHKAEIIAYAVQQRLPLHLTYSCEAGTAPPCGECRSCNDRSTLPC